MIWTIFDFFFYIFGEKTDSIYLAKVEKDLKQFCAVSSN